MKNERMKMARRRKMRYANAIEGILGMKFGNKIIE